MKLIKGVCAGVSLFALIYASAAYTAPAEGEIIRYYDANHIQVGYSEQTCTGRTNYIGNTHTDYYEIDTYSCGFPPYHPQDPAPENCGWDHFLDC